jgi:drug/metabolite transporter (DMT)-like permease
VAAPVAAYWALIAVCFFWGTTYIAIRIAVHDVPPLLFASVRFLMAALPVLAYALYKGEKRPTRKDLKRIFLVAFMLLTCGNGTLAWAEQWVPVAIASLIIVSTPFWMVLFARATGHQVSRRAMGGLLVGFGGLIVVLWPEIRGADLASGVLLGSAGLVGSSAMWAFGSVYVKNNPVSAGPWMKMGLEMLVASGYLLFLAVLRGEPALWAPTPASWAATVYLAVFGSIVGYGSYTYALKHLPTEQVSIYAYVNPIVAIVLGVVMLGEMVGPYLLLGTPLVILGVYLINTGKRRNQEPPALRTTHRAIAD